MSSSAPLLRSFGSPPTRSGSGRPSRLRNCVSVQREDQVSGQSVSSPVWRQAALVNISSPRSESRDSDNLAIELANVSDADDDVSLQEEEEQEDDAPGPPSGNLTQQRTVELFPKGNLSLIVGNEQRETGTRTLIVLFDNIKVLSDKWKEVVGKSTIKGFTKRQTQIQLPNDDADMMLVLMSIVHSQFKHVPTQLSFRQVLEMARICRKYDTNDKVERFMEDWVAPHHTGILQSGHEQWLFVAHQFRLQQDYMQLTRHLVLHCRVSVEGKLLAPGTDQELKGSYPTDTLHWIAQVRRKVLANFLDTTYRFVARMVDSNTCQAVNPTPPQPEVSDEERSHCTLLNHGTIVRHLNEQGYWPPVIRGSNLRESVFEVAEKLQSAPAIKESLRCVRNDSITWAGTGIAPPTVPNRHFRCDGAQILGADIKSLLGGLVLTVQEHVAKIIGERELA